MHLDRRSDDTTRDLVEPIFFFHLRDLGVFGGQMRYG
jgi:hypothetical protein